MSRQIHAISCLVKRTVESRDKEHEYLSAHTQEQEEVGSRQVGQFKQCTKDHDRGTPTIGIVEERLSGYAIHPLLQTVYDIEFAILCHLFFLLLFCFTLDEVAIDRTQRNPMYERGWF